MSNNKARKKVFITSIVTVSVICIAILTCIWALWIKDKGTMQAKQEINENEIKRSMTYTNITEDPNYAKVDNCEYVEFSAFFTRDLDGDGYAERYNGTVNQINKKATLWFDINVMTAGKLEEGKITINGQNFKLTTALVKDEVIKNDYIGSGTNQIELNTINAGTQKLFGGTISALIGNNINNYSNSNNTITLTGTWVNGTTRTPINKTIKLTADWYGKTTTVPYRYYIDMDHDINEAVKEEDVTFNFSLGYEEIAEELIIQKQVTEVNISQFNGYDPISARVTSANATSTFENGVLTITREAKVDANGNVTQSVPRSNVYGVEVKYPLEAYTSWTGSAIGLVLPTVGYYYGFNNTSKEFAEQNPYMSQASKMYLHSWSEPHGDVAIFDIDTGTRVYDAPSTRTVVSKEMPVKIYNGIDVGDEIDTYPVRWRASTGNASLNNGIYMQSNGIDNFLTTSGDTISMENYVTTRGIYFTNFDNMLEPENAWIKVYDKDTNELLATFTNDDWNKYSASEPYEFEKTVKSIRIETSKARNNAYAYVYLIKEIDDEKLTTDFTRDQFNTLDFVSSYLEGGLIIDGKDSAINRSSDSANYEEPVSTANFEITPTGITNQETKNVTLKITPTASRYNEKKWANGQFVIEMPEEILEVEIQNIKCSNSNVEIISSEVYEESGKQYIKIYTRNDVETTYSIEINADITADPRKPTSNKSVKLYAINQYCNNYRDGKKTNDIFDINGNGNTTEQVYYETDNISIIAPSSLLTSQVLSNFDDKGTEVVSPQTAILDKSSIARDANINVTVTNNYSGTISETVIVGKIPFAGNSYQINGKELGSTYSVTMKNTGIVLPSAVASTAKVYYSSNTTVNNDLTDSSNNWKTADQVADWSQIKTYAIDLSSYVLQKGETLTFTYGIIIPANINYNDVSYSTHGVYFCLDTEDGKLKTRTEVNRLGIMIAKKFDISLTKYKQGTNTKVQGATYRVTDGTNTRTGITNENGIATISGLYVDKEYTLEEIASPDNYILNENAIKFKVTVDDAGNPHVTATGEMKGTATINNVSGTYTVNMAVEDVAKYDMEFIKIDSQSGELLKGVKFKLTGGRYGEFGGIFTTNANGEISIINLVPGTTYTLEETKATGYYVNQEKMTFTVTRNASGNLSITSSSNEIENAAISEIDGVDKAIISAPLVNEKIPTYSFNINKKNKDNQGLAGTQFKLRSIDTGEEFYGTTNESGVVTFDGLYQYVEGKYITGEYILQEIVATEGYVTDTTEVKFRASMSSGVLNIEILEGAGAVKAYSSNSTSITFNIENKPIFRLTKTGDNGAPLANAKFKITDLDGNPAKDTNGNPIGELEGVPAINLVFESTGSQAWTQKEDGTWQSGGYHVNNANSVMTARFTLEETRTLTFDWAASSESTSYDYVYYTITNLITNDTYGTGNTNNTKLGGGDNSDTYEGLSFKKVEKELEAGTYEIKFTYKKDSSVDKGLDSGFVRNAKINGNGYYAITTDENGEIAANLPEGLYMVEEVEAPEGYRLPEKAEDRIQYVGIGKNRPEESAFGNKWIQTIKGAGHSKIYDMKATSDGGYVIAGSFAGECDLNADGIVDFTAKGETDAYIVKYNANGEYQWHYILGTTGADEFKRIDTTTDGGYVAVGYEYSSTYRDSVVVKVNSSGAQVWKQKPVTVPSGKNAYDDELTGVKVLPNGNIVITGNFYGEDVNVGTTLHSNANQRHQGFVAWLYSDGSYKSSIALTGSDVSTSVRSNVNVTDVTVTNVGVVVSVDYIGKLNINGTELNTTTNQQDSVLIRYSLDGGYQNYTPITGTNTESIGKVITDNEDNIIALGGFGSTLTLGSDTITPKTENVSNAMMLKFRSNGEYMSNYVVGTTSSINDNKFTSAVSTSDGGLLIGGWFYSANIDIDGDGTNDITNKGQGDGILIKLKEDGTVEWAKQIGGTLIDSTHAVAELKDKTYVAAGNFNSTSLTVDTTASALTMQGATDAYMAAFGRIVTAAEIPQRQTIEVVNEIKKFKITTEIDENLEGQRTGGTITGTPTGQEYINLVEEVKYGYDSTVPIVITPSANYSVYKVTINDEEVQFTPDANGVVTLPIFEDVTHDYHIKVIFEKNISNVLVHHYLKDRNGNYTTTSLAKDEYYQGKIGDNYSTSPKLDIEINGIMYNIAKVVDLTGYEVSGNYALPTNRSGQFTATQTVVTYYYEENPFTLTVHHYLEGTEDKLAEDVIINELHEGSGYTTTPSAEALAKGYDLVPELTTVNLDESKYIKDSETNNITGNIEQDTIVTYYYRLKKYNITTKVTPITVKKFNEITNEYEDIVVKGGTILGEGETPYETVVRGEDSTKDIRITPDKGYRIKNITINGVAIEDTGIGITTETDGSVLLDKFTNMTEDKEVIVEFEPIYGKLIVNHYIEGTTDPVPLNDETVAQTDERERYVGDPYATKQLENLAENWEFVRVEGEPSGEYIDGTITVTYYYKLKELAKITAIKSWEAEPRRTYIDAEGKEVQYVLEGDTITYTITVTNEGKAGKIVNVKDTIPTGTTFIDNSIEVKVNGTTVETTGNLTEGVEIDMPAKSGEVNAEATVSFKVKVTAEAIETGKFEGTITNTATVDDVNTDPVVTPVKKVNVDISKSSTVVANTKLPDRKLNGYISSKDAEITDVPAGYEVIANEEITYSIKLDNSKGTAPTKVRVKDSAPKGTAFKDGSIRLENVNADGTTIESTNIDGTSIDLSGKTEADLRDTGIEVELNAGEIKVLSFTVTVVDTNNKTENDLADNTSITNTAKVSKNPEEPNPTYEDTNKVTHIYVEPIITATKDYKATPERKYINKEGTEIKYVSEGDTITYTITVENEGGLAKENVKVTDELPKGVTFGEQNVIRVNGKDTTYTLDDLQINGIFVNVPAKVGDVKGKVTVSFEVTVDKLVDESGNPIYYRQLKNVATVDGEDTDPVVTNVNKSHIVFGKTVTVGSDATGEGNTTDGNNKEVKLGETLTYAINVSNTGTLPDTVTISDNIPEKTTYVDNTISVKVGDRTYTAEEINGGVEGITLVKVGETVTGILVENVNINPEEDVIVSFKVKVTKEANNGDIITNTATVNEKPTEPVTNPVARPIIEVHKEIAEVVHMNEDKEIEGLKDRKDYVFRGDKITYNIKATNTGSAEGSVIIKDIISNKVELDVNSIKVDSTTITGINSEKFANEGIEVTVPAKTADKAGEVILSFTVTVKETTGNETESADNGNGTTGDVVNQAKWSYKNPIEDPNPEEPDPETPDIPKDHTTDEVKVPIVVIEKKAEIIRTTEANQTLPEKTVTAKDEIKYTIVVTNTGTLDIGELIVKDTEPEGTTIKDELEYHDEDLTNGEVTDNEVTDNSETNKKEISWKINNLSASQEGSTNNIAGRSFTVTVDYDAVASKEILNTAYVNDKPTNETKTSYKKPTPKITTDIIKTGDETTMIGNKIYYKITYTATIEDFVGKADIVIEDQLPYGIVQDNSNLTYVSTDGTVSDEVIKASENLRFVGVDGNTIKWEMTEENIDTYKTGTPHEIELVKEMLLYYDTETLGESITNTAVGTIQLKEPNPDNPDEYINVGKEIPDDATHTVTVKTAYKLPDTGRNGTTIFAIIGLMIVGAAAVMGYKAKRKEN